MPGVVDILRILYEVDYRDRATGPLDAGQKRVARGVVQTSRALAQQDVAVKRSATVAADASTKRAASQLKVSRAEIAAAKAADNAAAADVRQRGAVQALAEAQARQAKVSKAASATDAQKARADIALERAQVRLRTSTTGVANAHLRERQAAASAAAAGRAAAATAHQAEAAYNGQAAAVRRLTITERAQSAGARAAARMQATTMPSGRSAAIGGGAAMLGRISPVGLGAAAVVGGAGAAVKVFAGFEAEMSRVGALSDASRKQLAALTQQAQMLGSTTNFSNREAAGGMSELAASGFSVNEIMKTIPGTLSLAAASGTDLANAAAIQATQLRAFGLPASKAGHVADVLTVAVNRSAISMDDLGESMSYVAPVAGRFNQTFEDMSASVAILGNVGIKGSMAGTAIRRGLVSVIKPSTRTMDALNGVGISTTKFAKIANDSHGKLRPLPRIIGGLATALKGVDAASKRRVLAQLFGTEALPGMITLVGKGEKGINRMSRAMRDARGEADKTAHRMRDNVAGAFDNVKGAVESAATALVAMRSGALKQGLQGVAGFITALSGQGAKKPLPTRTERMRSSSNTALRRDAQAAVQARQTATPGTAQKLAGAVRGVVNTVIDSAKRLGPVLIDAGKQLLDAFKPAVPFLRNVLLPLFKGVAIGVIGTVVAAFKIAVPVIKVVATVLGFVGKAARPLRGVIQGVGTVIGFLVGGPILKLLSKLPKVGGAFRLLGAPIKFVIGSVGRVIGWFAKLPGALGGFVGRAVNRVISITGGLPGKVKGLIGSIAKGFFGLGKSIVTAIVNGVKSAPGAILNALKGMIPGPIRKIASKIPVVGGLFKRRGGVIRRFQDGGLVPIAASGGELLVDGGRSMVIPGRDDRDGTFMMARPGSHVVTYDGQARMAAGASLHEAIRSQAPHFAKGGKVPKWYGPEKISAGSYSSTSYGPPWGGIQGSGRTRTGVDLRGGPHRYIVAVDPSLISLKSKVYAQPNPFGYGGMFSAEDTGGAIKGRRIDFYDWRGRARQNAWGRQPVRVSAKSIAKTKTVTETVLAASRRREGLIDDAFSQGIDAGRGGLTRRAIRSEGNPIITALREQTQTPASSSGSGRAIADGGKPGSIALTRQVAASTKVPYVFGGGHAGFAVKAGADCSGYVSYVAHRAGWQPRMTAPMATGALSGYGRSGRGRHVTVHVRNGGVAGGHTMLTVDGKGYSSGNRSTGRLSGRYDVSAAYLRTLPVKRHPVGMRTGGTIGRSRTASVKVAAGAVPLNRGVRNALTMAGGSLEDLDELLGRSVEGRIEDLRGQIERSVQRGGPAKVVKRLQSVLSVIDFELGRRVGRIQDVVEQRTAALERGSGAVDRVMRKRGIAADSSQGIGVMQVQQAAETGVRKQNVASLERALRIAVGKHDRQAIRDATDSLHTVLDDLDESMTKQIELRRDAIRAAAEEHVGAAEFAQSLSQTGGSMLEAQQRLAGTQDTPDAMRQRAGYQSSVVIPAMQAVQVAQQAKAAQLASIGDLDGWRQAVQDATSAAVDIANAQADAADMIREAAAKQAQDRVDVATHGSTMADLGLERLDAEQQLIGTHDSAGGAQGRADFIRQQIVPAIQGEIAALQQQEAEARAAGNTDLVRQLDEQIFGRQTDLLKANLDANQQTADNTDALKDFGGSTAFSYRDQTFTDLDVIRARTGA